MQEHRVDAAVIDREVSNRLRKYIRAYKAHLIAGTTGIDRLDLKARKDHCKVVYEKNSSSYEQPEAIRAVRVFVFACCS